EHRRSGTGRQWHRSLRGRRQRHAALGPLGGRRHGRALHGQADYRAARSAPLPAISPPSVGALDDGRGRGRGRDRRHGPSARLRRARPYPARGEAPDPQRRRRAAGLRRGSGRRPPRRKRHRSGLRRL
ncbi:MAG: Mannose-1-phosphate guanylyltransferase / Mannose-6-phosphate isomerase, partial [uncultured Microvirga sp.]